MIMVLTGNGKGKTTSAIGQAVRALGHGKRVLIIQFIKGPWEAGEEKFFKKTRIPASRFQFLKYGKGFVGILGDKLPFSVHKKAAEKALVLAKKAIKSKKWDFIILDEINVAAELRLIKVNEVLKIIGINRQNQHKSALDIILTGRGAPKSFIKIADLITEMKEIKHPFQKGKRAKKGVEF